MLKQRVVTALVLVAFLSLILFYLPAEFAVLTFAVIAALAAWEWSRLSEFSSAGRVLFPLWIIACCGLCWTFPGSQVWLCLLAAAFWLLMPLWLATRWKLDNPLLRGVTGTVVLLPAWIGLVRLHALGVWTLLAAMSLVWVADIAAYFVGRAFGRHKLAPAISPGKTWEGATGALFGGLLYVFMIAHWFPLPLAEQPVLLALCTSLLVTVSIVGDLFESMIKRQAEVKDSSGLLPGHGGVLDRIDSLTSTLPVLVALLYIETLWRSTP